MKIVVDKIDDNKPYLWQWSIVDKGKVVAESVAFYNRGSDAKRGADRFEQKLWMFYQNVEDDGQGIPIEVIG